MGIDPHYSTTCLSLQEVVLPGSASLTGSALPFAMTAYVLELGPLVTAILCFASFRLWDEAF